MSAGELERLRSILMRARFSELEIESILWAKGDLGPEPPEETKSDWLIGMIGQTLISAIVIGLAIDYLVYRPLRRRRASPAIILIASVAVLLVIESLNLIFFGADVKSINFIDINSGLHLGPVIITNLLPV